MIGEVYMIHDEPGLDRLLVPARAGCRTTTHHQPGRPRTYRARDARARLIGAGAGALFLPFFQSRSRRVVFLRRTRPVLLFVLER